MTAMKMLAEYLDNAVQFEQMAADEKDPKLKAEFERQAATYRRLAETKAKEHGLKMPPDKINSRSTPLAAASSVKRKPAAPRPMRRG